VQTRSATGSFEIGVKIHTFSSLCVTLSAEYLTILGQPLDPAGKTCFDN
jgi:hypothetical protein